MRENVATRAARLLTERRVDVRSRDRRHVHAVVIGDHAAAHDVTWAGRDGWACTCEAARYRSTCAHVTAVQHVVIVNRSGEAQ